MEDGVFQYALHVLAIAHVVPSHGVLSRHHHEAENHLYGHTQTLQAHKTSIVMMCDATSLHGQGKKLGIRVKIHNHLVDDIQDGVHGDLERDREGGEPLGEKPHDRVARPNENGHPAHFTCDGIKQSHKLDANGTA